MGMDMVKVQRFVYLTRRIKELEDELGPLEKEREDLEPLVQAEFAKSGVKNLNIDGYTIYVERKLWAKYPSREEAIEALKATGHEEYVYADFNHNSVSALVREIVKGEEGEKDATDGSSRLPEEWQGKLGFVEKFKAKAVRA
jgi:hypothetical protein